MHGAISACVKIFGFEQVAYAARCFPVLPLRYKLRLSCRTAGVIDDMHGSTQRSFFLSFFLSFNSKPGIRGPRPLIGLLHCRIGGYDKHQADC